jgi:D-arabinose 5-phosphate isomerase GutQ
MSRIDLEPATCGDPDCEADHGYTGALTSDDFTLRVSEAGDGTNRVRDLLTFARALSAATVSVR